MKKIFKIISIILLGVCFIFGVLVYETYKNLSNSSDEVGYINLNFSNNSLYSSNQINTYTVFKDQKFQKSSTTPEHVINEINDFKIELSTDYEVEKLAITVFKDNIIILETSSYRAVEEIIVKNTEDAIFTIKSVIDYKYQLSSGQYISEEVINVDFPMEVILDKSEIHRGDFIKVRVINKNIEDELVLTSDLQRFDLLLFPDGNDLFGLLPIDYRNKVGSYCLNINEECTSIEITDKTFREVHFNISSDTLGKTTTNSAYKEYNTLIAAALAEKDEPRMYEDEFVAPTTGRLSSDFLDTRYINGATTPSSYHSGIDIANSIGTEIVATASGRVTLAKSLQVTGNTVVIYHGDNLYSFYLHCNELTVTEGQLVTQGELIAYMGTTGLSTGSHLHFSIRVGNSYVDPWYFIERW